MAKDRRRRATRWRSVASICRRWQSRYRRKGFGGTRGRSDVTREVFRPRRFKADALRTIEEANAIIAEYAAQGFKLILRSIHYQFVTRDLHANTAENYKRLGVTLLQARDAGLSDWGAVEDRSREVRDYASWNSPADIVAAAARSYRGGRPPDASIQNNSGLPRGPAGASGAS
jgi:hypothetical protein